MRDISSSLPPPPQIDTVPVIPVTSAGADPDLETLVEHDEAIREQNKYKVRLL